MISKEGETFQRVHSCLADLASSYVSLPNCHWFKSILISQLHLYILNMCACLMPEGCVPMIVIDCCVPMIVIDYC